MHLFQICSAVACGFFAGMCLAYKQPGKCAICLALVVMDLIIALHN
jgi:hypothetical protein